MKHNPLNFLGGLQKTIHIKLYRANLLKKKKPFKTNIIILCLYVHDTFSSFNAKEF
jgi:hypothetical protein